jgi:hypothetical protein
MEATSFIVGWLFILGIVFVILRGSASTYLGLLGI